MLQRKRRAGMGVAVAFAALVGVAVAGNESVATAQQGNKSSQGQTSSQGQANLQGPNGFDMKTVTQNPQQMVTVGTGLVQDMQQGRDSVAINLQQAHESRDPIKINAYSDILNQLDVLVKSANERLSSLGAAVKVNDIDLATHEFQIIVTLHDNAKSLLVQSKSVVGSELSTLDQGNIAVTIDITLPGPGATDPLSFLPNIIILPINNASATK